VLTNLEVKEGKKCQNSLHITIVLLASNNFIAENGIPFSPTDPVKYFHYDGTSYDDGICGWKRNPVVRLLLWCQITIVMSSMVQFCICDFVQHEIEYGRTDGRTHCNLLYYLTPCYERDRHAYESITYPLITSSFIILAWRSLSPHSPPNNQLKYYCYLLLISHRSW